MSNNREIPLMEFEADASVPILRYDVPSPSSYEGRNFIELKLDAPEEFFSNAAKTKPTLDDMIEANQEEIYEYLSSVSKEELERLVYSIDLEGIARGEIGTLAIRSIYPSGAAAEGSGSAKGLIERPTFRSAEMEKALAKTREKIKEEDTLEKRYEIFKSCLEMAFRENKYPTFYRTMGGRVKLKFAMAPEEAEPRLIFIETYRLTSYPGDYGAGITIKTFSLLPGEETEISMKTWKKESTTTKKASSILDSYTEEKADELESAIQNENSTTVKVEKSSSYHVEAEAKASWGFGSAKVSGGAKGSSNSARERFSKGVMNATDKESNASSSKREINIDTSYERSVEEGVETAIMRTIKNLNASRTLNFVFRQMNQEFHSLLHLTDLRVAFYNGYPGSMREYSLYELGDLVVEFMKPEVPFESGSLDTLKYLEDLVMGEYGTDRVYDYQGNPQTLIEMVELPAESGGVPHTYLRVIPPRKDPETGEQIGRQKYIMREKDEEKEEDARYVDGIILSAKRFTMRTDGVIVESLLGKAPALDEYALNTQIEVLREKQLGNKRIQSGLDLVEKLKEEDKIDKAVKAYKDLFVPQPKPE